MSASCRSSGVLTASAVVFGDRCKLVSIHICGTGSGPTTVKLFDNASAASGKEMVRLSMQPDSNAEMDLHGAICSNGIYLDISTGGGAGAAVSVHYS
mgnify:CR=1 FL=1